MTAQAPDAVIWGVTRSGRTFRPSDWAERLAGLTAAFGPERQTVFAELVAPVTLRGARGVIVGARLASLEPRFYNFLLGFARDNDLTVSFVEGALAHPQMLEPPGAGRRSEPREPV
jgi:hypothetical protein